MIACSLDNLPEEKPEEVDELGYLQMGDVVVTGDIENMGDNGDLETESNAPRTRAQVNTNNLPQAADSYYVEIVNVANNTVVWHGTYAEAKSTTKYSSTAGRIGLEPGHYVVYAYQTENKEPQSGVTSAPYYTGKSNEIEILTSSKQHDDIPTAVVICSMANVKVTIEHSADLKMLFRSKGSNSIAVNPTEGKELETKVDMTAAQNTATASNTFAWNSTHENPVYFTDIAGPNSANTLKLQLEGYYYAGKPTDVYDADYKGEDVAGGRNNANWKHVTMTHTISNVKAAQWRKISIDIDNNTTGNVKFIFKIESYTYDEEIEVKMMEVFTNLNMEESMPDDEISDPLAPAVKIVGNAENSYNYAIDASKFNANASQSGNIAWTKYFEADITPQEGTTVESVYAVLKYTSDEKLREAMVARGYTNSRIDLYPENKATTYANITSSGSKMILTLTAAGMNAFYKYPGEHTIRLYTVDSEQRVGFVDILLTVTQGGVSTGNGPTVVWIKDNKDVIDDTHTLDSTNPYSAIITVTSETGLTGLTVSMSDTSGALNDTLLASPGVDLATNMDLFKPVDVNMENALIKLGLLPAGESIFDETTDSPLKGMTKYDFDITNFTPLLYTLISTSQSTVEDKIATFTITVSDAGGSTTKNVIFIIE